MTPVINPKLCPSAADSWQAWGSCNHFDNETEKDISSSAGLTQSVEDRSEPRMSNEDRMLDQTTPCGDQACDGDLKNDVGTGDGQVQCSDVITDNSEKEENDGNFNVRFTGNSDENIESTSANANEDEQNHFIDDVTNLPAKESTHLQVQTEVNTNTDDAVKSEVTGCLECKKLRQRKEKIFLSKNKSCTKFAWNRHLLCGFEGAVHPDWILHIVNGFVGQSGILSFHCLYLVQGNEQTAFYKRFY